MKHYIKLILFAALTVGMFAFTHWMACLSHNAVAESVLEGFYGFMAFLGVVATIVGVLHVYLIMVDM